MATIVQTLDVSTVDEDGKTTTFKLDNFKENIKKNQVIEAFQYGINNGLLMSNYGSAIKSVGTVMKSTSTKIELEGEPVYITPNNLENLSITSAGLNTTVTVANASGMLQAASLMDLEKSGPEDNSANCYISSINESAGTYTITIHFNADITGVTFTGRLNIVINGTNNYVPFSASRI